MTYRSTCRYDYEMHKVFIFIIQLLLISICSAAVEETLEERKQRIMRKYARIKTTITQSDIEVVNAPSEDERVIASEIMQVEDVRFERHEPERMIRPPVVQQNLQMKQSNWLLDSEEIDFEENRDQQGEYWSMFGAPEEKPERAASREHIYHSRERELQKDIFGFSAPEEGPLDRGVISRGSSVGLQGKSRTQWGTLTEQSFSDRSVYVSPYSREQTSSHDQRVQSIDRTPSVEAFRNPVFVKPLPESAESFTRPQVDFTPRVQIQRANPWSDNRDLDRFIEQNKR